MAADRDWRQVLQWMLLSALRLLNHENVLFKMNKQIIVFINSLNTKSENAHILKSWQWSGHALRSQKF